MRRKQLQSAILMAVILALFLGGWQIAATPAAGSAVVDPEYAALVGAAAAQGQKTPMPRPSDIAERAWVLLRDPFYIHGTNDQGIGIQLGYSLLRVALGFGLAVLVAVPARLPHRHEPGVERGAGPDHPGAAAGQPASLDAAGALHDQG